MRGSDGTGDERGERSRTEFAIYPSEAPGGWRLVGELTSETAQQVVAAFAGAGDGRGDLRLDLAGVTFVDTIGLHVIARAAAELTGGRRLVLDSPDPWLRRVLLLAGIDAVPNLRLTDGSP